MNPKQRERFFLRLSLLHVKGSTSYDALEIYNNTNYDTFYETAVPRKLVSTDEECDKCLNETSQYKFPYNICKLFSYICVFQHPINSAELFNKYKIHFYPPKMDEKSCEQFALKYINNILQTHGDTTNDFKQL